MARNKEVLVLLLDVGPSMQGVLPEVEKICSTLVHKKLVYNRSDELGIVLFGTEETSNDLAKELGGYRHVVVARNIEVVDGETSNALQNLPRGTAPGDFLDAIVVGLDMLIRKFQGTKVKQRICLITDAQYPLREPPQGTKEDQVDTISEQMKTHGIKIDCIVFREPGVPRHHVMEENDRLLDRFSVRSVAQVVQVENPISLLGALKTRNILPVTVFRGDLEVSSNFKIRVWVYKKTSEEKFPTLKKYSDKAPSNDKFASHEVKVDYEYKNILEPQKVVPPEQRIKGYLYGPQVIPISSAEWEAVKYKPEKGVKLLGFTDKSNILRHYFMKDVYSFIPEPGNAKAIVAVSAIARAMQATNKVAILRCVWRHGQGNVAFGVLTPNISSVNNVPDSFYFNILPFAEDVREFQFRSFNSLPSSSVPTEEQQEAADNLVRMLDLASPGREEILRPDFTPNPVLERFYSFLDLKSKQADANLPPLDRCLRRITEPDPHVVGHKKPLIQSFHEVFGLKENPKKKKARTQHEKLTYAGVDDQAKMLEEPSPEQIRKIGDLNPIQDFEVMLAERASSKWVQKAIEEMQKYTTNLLENSHEGNTYQKALECFVALRKACIVEQEPNEFNRFLAELYDRWRNTDLADFFELLASKNITLISKKEASDSDTTEEEANSFYVKPESSQ